MVAKSYGANKCEMFLFTVKQAVNKMQMALFKEKLNQFLLFADWMIDDRINIS